jgi:hypothetical protein
MLEQEFEKEADTSDADIEAVIAKSSETQEEVIEDNQGAEDFNEEETPSDEQGENIQEKTKAQIQEELDWLKDNRAEKMWKKDPNNMYKVLKNLEKISTPTHMALKKFGINDHKELEETLNKYAELASPENPQNIILSELENWLSNDATRTKVNEFFNEMRIAQKKQEASQLLGYNVDNEHLTPQMIRFMEEQSQVKQELAQLKAQKAKEEKEKALDTTLDSIQKMVKDYGIEEYDETKFLQEAVEQRIPLEQLESYFLKNAFTKIAQVSKAKGEKAVLNNLKKNKFSGIAPDGGKAVAAKSNDTEAEFNDALDRLIQ